jgi:hypothetical protein
MPLSTIPMMLESLKMGFLMGKAGFRPSDICVSAPTGSGKTLAFVLPIIQVIIFNTRCVLSILCHLQIYRGSLWSYGSWIFKYLCNQCLSPLTLSLNTIHGEKVLWMNFVQNFTMTRQRINIKWGRINLNIKTVVLLFITITWLQHCHCNWYCHYTSGCVAINQTWYWGLWFVHSLWN